MFENKEAFKKEFQIRLIEKYIEALKREINKCKIKKEDYSS